MLASTRPVAEGAEVVLTRLDGSAARVIAQVRSTGAVWVIDWSGDESALLLAGVHRSEDMGSGQANLSILRIGSATPEPLVGDILANPHTAHFDPSDPTKVYTVGASASAPDLVNGIYRLSSTDPPFAVVPGSPRRAGKTAAFVSLGVSPDGARLVLNARGAFYEAHVSIIPADGSAGWVPILDAPDMFSASSASFSTDGAWVYLFAGYTKRDVYRAPASGGAPLDRLTNTPTVDELSARAIPGTLPDLAAPHGLTARPDGERMALRWARASKSTGPLVLRRFAGIRPSGTGVRVPLETPTSTTDDVRVGRTYTYRLTAKGGGSPAWVTVTATARPQLRSPVLASDQATEPTYRVNWTTPGNAASTWYSVRNRDRWSGWFSEGFATTMRFEPPVLPGATQWWEARAIDRFGNATPRARSTTTVPRDDAAAFRSQGWETVADDNAWEGSVLRSSRQGAKATYAFDVGRADAKSWHRLWMIGERGPRHGAVAVVVDGHRLAVTDTRSKKLLRRQRLWSGRARLSAGRHRLRVVVLGTHGRPFVGIDGFAVRPPPPIPRSVATWRPLSGQTG